VGKIKVINKKVDRNLSNEVYIGRGSILGNKFVIGEGVSRAESCALYDAWLKKEMERRKKVYSYMFNLTKKIARTKGTTWLGCYCKPKQCHGDSVKEQLEILIKKFKK
jgi:hypothetical protein